MATFVLILTMVFTPAHGDRTKVINMVYPEAMTYEECMDIHKTTAKGRVKFAREVGARRNLAVKHVFATCSNVKKLLDSQGFKNS